MTLFKSEALEDLTICIFTAERKLDLERSVKFLTTTGAKIIILDASHKPIFLFETDKVKYFHVPKMQLQQRLMKFAELATTKYILLSPDDDYWALNGVCEALKFLEENLDYASVQGLRIRFFDFPLFYWIPDYISQMTLHYYQDNKVERLRDMAIGMHYIYSVIRQNEFVKITNCFKDVNSTKRDSLMMSELIFNYTLPVLGKHRVLPVFYSARKAHPYEAGDVNFGLWINDRSDVGAVKFTSNILDFYSKELSISRPEAYSLFQQLTKELTRKKPALKDKSKETKRYLKRIIPTTKLRWFRKISKVKYLFFYKLLFTHKTFTIFVKDVVRIREFLNKNRINQ
jgi:glycosyltransferase domain-containing protein